MKKKICIISLDSADYRLIQKWSYKGYLPNLHHLLKNGSIVKLKNSKIFRNEIPWESMLTGCSPDMTGYWTPIKYDSSSYKVMNAGAYNYDKYPPFYSKLSGKTITVFDLPHCGKIFPLIEGVQALGWGAHSPMCNGISNPGKLIEDIRKRFGEHPVMQIQNKGSWWDESLLHRINSKLIEGLHIRGKVMKYLVKNFPSDLMFFSFSEIHIASHHFLHLTDKSHPLFNKNFSKIPDFLLEIYKETDRQLGLLIENLPTSSNVIVLSPMGSEQSWSDINSMIILPEFLYRWNFPGKKLFKNNSYQQSESPIIPDSNHWVRTIWKMYYDSIPPGWVPKYFQGLFRKLAGKDWLQYPFYILRLLGKHQWHPSAWYQPWWPKMKAFALPGYGDGYIRFNVKGRDRFGIIDESETDCLSNELKEKLFELKNPITKEKLVDQIFITKKDLKHIPERNIPDADMIVNWKLQANDIVSWEESQILGPVPFWKSGSHNSTGFMLSQDLNLNSKLGKDYSFSVYDVAPTILNLLNVPPPKYFNNISIFNSE